MLISFSLDALQIPGWKRAQRKNLRREFLRRIRRGISLKRCRMESAVWVFAGTGFPDNAKASHLLLRKRRCLLPLRSVAWYRKNAIFKSRTSSMPYQLPPFFCNPSPRSDTPSASKMTARPGKTEPKEQSSDTSRILRASVKSGHRAAGHRAGKLMPASENGVVETDCHRKKWTDYIGRICTNMIRRWETPIRRALFDIVHIFACEIRFW